MRPLLALLALVLFAGCDSTGEDDFYTVGVFELESGARFLRVRTPEEYPCANYPLLTDVDVVAGGLDVEILGVGDAPEICLTAIGPATFTRELDARVATDGYRIRIARGGDVDTYRLAVGEGGLGLVPVEASFSVVADV